MNVIVLGGGVIGLASGIMLARDGHRVTVLERDPATSPESPEAAWEGWARDGVAQFRQAHYLQARGRVVLDAELPDVRDALLDAGALRIDQLSWMPAQIADREPRPGDERMATITARRTTLEQVFATAADEQEGLELRRGVAAARLDAAVRDGGLRVAGVWTEDGERLAADLVVDAMGRRSRLPKLIQEAGGAAPAEEAEDSGFIYYTRFFRSEDGSTPEPRAPLLTHFAAHTVLTLPADSGTWSVTLYASSRDQELKRLRHVEAFTATVRACPLHSHWLDGEPMTGVMAMGGVLDRCRRINAGGRPLVTGLVAVGDAWACTNPSLGRGIALGLLHASVLRASVAAHDRDPLALALGYDEATERELMPWYRATVAVDRGRLAQLDAVRLGVPVPQADTPAARIGAAMFAAMGRDAEAFRAGLELSNCLTLPSEVFSRPGFAERMLSLPSGSARRMPGPSREELLSLTNGAGARAAAR